jgi:hypothetical protein
MFSRRLLISAAAFIPLGGCMSLVPTHIGDEDPALGEAFKYDQAAQVINPAPVYAADSTQPGSNGDVGASAVKRYRTDKVKPVETMQTTTGIAGSGGGMSGGGGPQ